MEKATISQLKNKLSAYLDKVRAGETVLILDRERPIARIERIGPDNASDDRLIRLERAGLLRRARTPLTAEILSEAVPESNAGVLRALLDERDDGR